MTEAASAGMTDVAGAGMTERGRGYLAALRTKLRPRLPRAPLPHGNEGGGRAGLRAELSEIPAASAGMTEAASAGMTEAASAGMTDVAGAGMTERQARV